MGVGKVGTFQPIPGSLVIVRDIDIRVLEEGDGGQPSVDDHVGPDVERQHLSEGSCLGPQIEAINNNAKANVGKGDLKEHAGRKELVGYNEVAGKAPSRASCNP